MNYCPNCGYHLAGGGDVAPTLSAANGFVCPDEVNCTWRMNPLGTKWRCAHGVITNKHPNGYCDGGCCR